MILRLWRKHREHPVMAGKIGQRPGSRSTAAGNDGTDIDQAPIIEFGPANARRLKQFGTGPRRGDRGYFPGSNWRSVSASSARPAKVSTSDSATSRISSYREPPGDNWQGLSSPRESSILGGWLQLSCESCELLRAKPAGRLPAAIRQAGVRRWLRRAAAASAGENNSGYQKD